MADDKRIIIDEDWKDRVRREKEEAARKAAEEEHQRSAAASSPASPAADDGAEAIDYADDGEDAEQLDEIEGTPFMALVQSLATQALLFLGYLAPPDSRQVMVDIGQARLVIDMLVDLRQKTQGNLNNDEQTMLAEAIAELQRAYVVRAQQAQEATLKQTGIDAQHLGRKPR